MKVHLMRHNNFPIPEEIGDSRRSTQAEPRLNLMEACILNEPLLMQKGTPGTTITWLNGGNTLTDMLTCVRDQKSPKLTATFVLRSRARQTN
jgi:hypothetical protein